MKRPNNISVISKAVLCIIIGLSLFVSACSPSDKYAVYQYDNGDDYFSEGLQRIVDKDGKMEKRSGDNWIPMPYNRKYEEGEAIQVFSAVGYLYAPHSTNSNINYTQPFSLKSDSGIYRLTKDFRVETAAGMDRKDSISVVFEIR